MVISQPDLRDLLIKIEANTPETIKPYKHIAVTGPSGSGKSSIIWKESDSILKVKSRIYDFSISGTSRKLRGNEKHGREYFSFGSEAEFHEREFIEDNSYLGNGKLYGTLRSEIERITIGQRKRACFDVDINGGVALKKIFKKNLFFVFLDVAIEILYDRLLRRMSETGETEQQIEARIIAAVKEKRKVQTGEVVPDYILPYNNSIRPSEAANTILVKSSYPFIVA